MEDSKKIEDFRKKAVEKLQTIITKEQFNKISPILDEYFAPSIFMTLLENLKDVIESTYHSVKKDIGDAIIGEFIDSLREMVDDG